MDKLHAFIDDSAPEFEGKIDVRSAPHEPRRHDSDDRSRFAVQEKRLADHSVIGGELPLPEAESEYADIAAAICATEDASHHGRDAHDLETIIGRVIPAQTLGNRTAGPEHVADRGRRHSFEDRGVVAELEQLIDSIVGAA